jgi:competence protein ComEC
VYSCGWRNRYGHPHSEVLARFCDVGAEAHRTDYQGWIKLAFADDGVNIQHWRDRHVRYWQQSVTD